MTRVTSLIVHLHKVYPFSCSEPSGVLKQLCYPNAFCFDGMTNVEKAFASASGIGMGFA